jgi:hypothetical protein
MLSLSPIATTQERNPPLADKQQEQKEAHLGSTLTFLLKPEPSFSNHNLCSPVLQIHTENE